MFSFRYLASLSTVTAVTWLLLSARFDALSLSLGALSVTCTVLLALRLRVIDGESQPVEISPRLVPYWVWLSGEIAKANIEVARRILKPRLAVDPVVVRVPAPQRTGIGRAIYANSITLTPGTVSLHVGRDYIDVHALTHRAAQDLASGEMARRIPDPRERRR